MKLYIENNQSLPSIQLLKNSDSVPEGYTESISIENLNKYSSSLISQFDYKFIRNEIKKLYTSIGWATLTTNEKVICSKWIIASPAERTQILTIEQQIGLGQLFARDSSYSRLTRSNRAISEVYNRLSYTDAKVIVDDVTVVKPLFQNYINFGQEGTLENDNEGLFDYIEARTGTTYSVTGFRLKNYTVIGYASMELFSVDIMKIFTGTIWE